MSSAENRPPRPWTGRDFIVPGPIGIAGEPTLEEWNEVRQAAFDELRKHPIPESLIQAVQEFRPHAEVNWVNAQGKPASLNEPAEPIVQPPKNESEEKSIKSLAESRLGDSFPRTAGDALAGCLRSLLARLRRSTNAPVRVGKMLPRSIIATIAIDILETNQLFGNVPGEELIQLMRELLNVDKNKIDANRQFAARYNASWILAQNERVPTRVLARTLGVDASSISRWRKEPAFRELIQNKKKAIIDLESRGLWPPKLKDHERLELIALRKKFSKLHSVMVAAGSVLSTLVGSARKPEGQNARKMRMLVREIKHELPEIEAEIKGIDYDLAPDPKGPPDPTL